MEDLPFDAGSFDMVHLRFLGLGIPETAWEPLLDNCGRILRRDTGILEVRVLVPIVSSMSDEDAFRLSR